MVDETSNIHVLRMDTALNILGEYIFNGDQLNHYYYLSSLAASPDGAIYVVGSVVDYNDAEPRPRAWIARVGPEQFVSVPELDQATISIYPNPGVTGFTLETSFLKPGSTVKVFDLLGNLVKEQLLNAATEYIELGSTVAGLYLVRVVARDGSSWSAKWLKE